MHKSLCIKNVFMRRELISIEDCIALFIKTYKIIQDPLTFMLFYNSDVNLNYFYSKK